MHLALMMEKGDTIAHVLQDSKEMDITYVMVSMHTLFLLFLITYEKELVNSTALQNNIIFY